MNTRRMKDIQRKEDLNDIMVFAVGVGVVMVTIFAIAFISMIAICG